ncbi:MAG: DJ-1/PfpI family protein [Pseudomonadota bacterium]|nr:DJ-1/PfpI family protein [Pseudomonadota bacterium]
MTSKPLSGMKIGILVASGFEELHVTGAQRALMEAGATVCMIGLDQGLVNGWIGKSWGHYFAIDAKIGETLATDYNALIVPGGDRAVTKLLSNKHVARVITTAIDAGFPLAVLGAGVEIIDFAGRAKGRKLTGAQNSATRMTEAGADWAGDDLIIQDEHILSARDDSNVDSFVEKMIALFVDKCEFRQAA